MANTRKVLERMPMDRYDWKPHDRSFSLGKLATHVAHLPGWLTMTLATDELDIGQPFQQPTPKTTGELLELFDQTAAQARASLAGAADEEFFKKWSLRNGDHVIFTMPKIAVVRGVVLNHLIHHRGQLTVYLRLNDVPVPGLYGPSADEGSF